MQNTIIVAIGNSILSDKNITFKIIDSLEEKINLENIRTSKISNLDLSFLDIIEGFSNVLILDTQKTGSISPGSFHIEDLKDESKSSGSKIYSSCSLNELINLGKKLELKMPKNIKTMYIEILDDKTISNTLSPQVFNSLDSATTKALELINE